MTKTILGISAYYHDAAAALLHDGAILAAAQEERFTRHKHDPSFPSNAVRFCLDHAGLSLGNVDAVVFYDKPWLKFERLLQTYYAFAPRGLVSFTAAMPAWIKEKIFSRNLLRAELGKIDPEGEDVPLLFSDHHLSHAASAFYPSPFAEAAILTVDGVGEWATASIGQGKGREIRILKEMRFPHSLGLFYSAFTYYLGFKVNSGEYKLMGLAPYGDPSSERCRRFREIILTKLVDIKEDGSLFLNQEYFDYATGSRMVPDRKWEKLFGVPARIPESGIEQQHADLALAAQAVTEEVVVRMGKTAQRLTGSRQLVLAGGVALNCVANSRLLRERIFDDIWIQPAAGDAGGALGAAYAACHLHFGQDRTVSAPDSMQGAYLGPAFNDADIIRTANRTKAPYRRFESFDELCGTVADAIAGGKVVGWFQDRMEWGPRALGNRSILGDARNPEMQKRMNLKVKFRESFRPFAPSVNEEDAAAYFESDHRSPYMLLIDDVKKERRCALPGGFHQLTSREKLYLRRSDLPAITHLDFSARLQTVSRSTNPRYWQLLDTFKRKTGCSVVINTSFNVRGEPIVCTPDDAYRCFMRTDIDLLVMGDCLFVKADQPGRAAAGTGNGEFPLD